MERGVENLPRVLNGRGYDDEAAEEGRKDDKEELMKCQRSDPVRFESIDSRRSSLK